MKSIKLDKQTFDVAFEQAEKNLFFRGQLWLKVVYDVRENVMITDFAGRIKRQIRVELQ